MRSDTRMCRILNDRQLGLCKDTSFKSHVSSLRASNIKLSSKKDFGSDFSASVMSVDLEENENRYLLTGCSDGSIYIHDVCNLSANGHFTAGLITRICHSRVSHHVGIETVSWYPSDNRLFIASGLDSKLKLWDSNKSQPVETFISKGKIYHHRCSWSSRALIAVAGQLSYVELVDLRTGNSSHQLAGHSGPVMATSWSPFSASILATSGLDGNVFLWDVRSAVGPLYRLDCGCGKAHSGLVNGMEFTPDGLHIITASADHEIKIWRADNGKLLETSFDKIKNDTLRHMELSFGEDILFFPLKGSIRAVRWTTGELITDLAGHFNRVNCCTYCRPYQELYSGGRDQTVLVWDNDEPSLDLEENEERVDQWSHGSSDELDCDDDIFH